jgi:putative peptidoglycan lipid II flippase
VATVLIYLVTVIVLVPTLGLFSLMVGESLKLLLHTAISAVILQRRVGGMARHGVLRAIGLSLIAAAAMGLVCYGALKGVEMLVPSGGLQEVLAVGVPGALGAAIYVGLVTVFRIEEMHQLLAAVRQRLARS